MARETRIIAQDPFRRAPVRPCRVFRLPREESRENERAGE